jgi:hypothetical protein
MTTQTKIRRPSIRSAAVIVWAALCMTLASLFLAAKSQAQGSVSSNTQSAGNDAAARLIAAYPDHLLKRDSNTLIWRDGTRMTIDDGTASKSHTQWLEQPDIKDMLRQTYPTRKSAKAPEVNSDPGRARNKAFFNKIYGDCTKGEVVKHLVDIVWLPKSAPTKLKISSISGVDKKLAAISAELDELGPKYISFLSPPAGTYNCRPIAGSQRLSAHGYGIAIDIAVRPSHYWQWQKTSSAQPLKWQNQIPIEIVHIFEKHGFIWGGRWHHYDTMHFEYRPELTAPN